MKSKVSSLDNQLEKISGQLKAEEGKCREVENKLKIKENEWKINKAALEEKAKAVSFTTLKLEFDKYCNKYANDKYFNKNRCIYSSCSHYYIIIYYCYYGFHCRRLFVVFTVTVLYYPPTSVACVGRMFEYVCLFICLFVQRITQKQNIS